MWTYVIYGPAIRSSHLFSFIFMQQDLTKNYNCWDQLALMSHDFAEYLIVLYTAVHYN